MMDMNLHGIKKLFIGNLHMLDNETWVMDIHITTENYKGDNTYMEINLFSKDKEVFEEWC